MPNLLDSLRRRGLIALLSDEGVGDCFDREQVLFYAGYDPSGPSLQLGNLFAVVTMRRLQLAGHKPVVLLGGATGMIGDPSGKSTERNLLDEATIEQNLTSIRKQLERLLDFGPGKTQAVFVDNREWFKPFSFLEFLRDVGKRFRLGEMLAKDSVKRRLESPEGISFTEFSYQILQAYDFLHLYRTMGVKLQIGGCDQWGNITAGIDLVRRVENATVYGMVIPLVTDSQGNKFGKSEGGAIYLDPQRTSPYQMYQYLLNSDDAKVIEYLFYFTFLGEEEIRELEKATATRPEERFAQKRLAEEVVSYVHGSEGLASALRATRIFFGETVENISEEELATIFADAPSITIGRDALSRGIPLYELLASSPLFSSKSEARRAIRQHGVYLNNRPVEDEGRIVTNADLPCRNALLLRKGKKNYCLVRVAD